METTQQVLFRKSARKPISAKRFAKLPKSSGCYATFAPISAKRGVKFCRNEAARDRVYSFQKRLHKFGLAPRVFETCELEIKGVTWYGYVTERAKLVVQVDANGTTQWDTRIDHDNQPLFDALDALGAQWNDRAERNYGLIGKKLVIIDCDPDFFKLSAESPLRGK